MAKLTIKQTALNQNQGQPAKLVVKPTALKQKQNQPPVNNANKWAKKNWAAFDFYYVFGLFEV